MTSSFAETTSSSEPRNEQRHSPEAASPAGTPDIAHPEGLIKLQSRPGQISFLVKAGRYCLTLDQETSPEGVVLKTGQPWICEHPDASLNIHVECTFLTANALRIRMGLEATFPFSVPYPVDHNFPPPILRETLFLPGALEEPAAGDARSDLVCGLELRADDGEIWVNPRGSGLELGWKASPFGLCGTWREPLSADIELNEQESGPIENENSRQSRPMVSHKVKPIFEQATLGPFTPELLPNGIMRFGDVLVGTELLILDEGEKLQSGGPGRHGDVSKTNGSVSITLEPVPEEARKSLSSPFGGEWSNEPVRAEAPPFLWTDRGWGLLIKETVQVRIAGLQDGRGVLGFMLRAGSQGMMDYIIVAGDALEACKAEFPVEMENVGKQE